jgi:hypothetical protein
VPGESQQVEVRLRFSQFGLPDLGRAAAAAAVAFKGLGKEQDAIDARQKSLYSGDTLRIAREMLRLQTERARLTRAESRQGLMSQREFRTSGRLLSDLRDQSQFHRQSTLEHFERRAVEHRVRREAVRSGAFRELAAAAFADQFHQRQGDRAEGAVEQSLRREHARSGKYAVEARADAREQVKDTLQAARERKIDHQLRMERVGNGTYGRLAAVADADRKRQDEGRRAEGAVDHARRVKRIDSGEYLGESRRRAAERERDRKAEERERRLDRQAELETKYGTRIGGRLHRFEQFAQRPGTRLATGAATAAAGSVFAAGMAGFHNTVEMNRLTTEVQLLSREIAGALKPAIDGLTDVLRFVRQTMQKLSPSQQDLLMYGTLGAVGVKGLSMASKAATGMGLFELGGAGLNLLAMRKASQAAKAAKVAETAGTASKVINGVEYAGRGAEVLGAGYLAKRAGFFGRLGGALGRLRGAHRGAGALAANPLTGPIAGAALATAGMFKSTYDAFTGGYYSHARETTPTHRGRSKVVSGGIAFGASIWDNIAASVNHLLPKGHEIPRYDKTFGVGEAGKTPAQKKKDQEARRTVTPADAGFEGTGAGFDRLMIATAVRDVQKEEQPGWFDDLMKWLDRRFGSDPPADDAPRVKSKES